MQTTSLPSAKEGNSLQTLPTPHIPMPAAPHQADPHDDSPTLSFVTSSRATKTIDYSLRRALAEIRNGRWRSQIERIRLKFNEAQNAGENPKNAVRDEKKALPAILFSGRFRSRSRPVAGQLIVHSGLICIDLDDVVDVDATRTRLTKSSHVRAIFLSPTATGLKVLISVQTTGAQHQRAWSAVRDHVISVTGLEVDEACKDVGRLCFVSCDPETWENPSAIPLAVACPTTPSPTSDEVNDSERSSPEIPSRRNGDAPHPATASLNSACLPTGSLPTVSLHNNDETSAFLHLCITSDSIRRINNQRESERIMASQPAELRALYDRFVRVEAESGKRNHAITITVPLLYTRVAEKRIMELHGVFYDCNHTLFKDPRDVHMHETESMIKLVAETYVRELSGPDRDVYLALNEEERGAYRICRDLSSRKAETRDPRTFFISFNDLGDRLGIVPARAQRLLRRLESYRLLQLICKGTKRAPGVRGKAGEYRWLLDGSSVTCP